MSPVRISPITQVVKEKLNQPGSMSMKVATPGSSKIFLVFLDKFGRRAKESAVTFTADVSAQ